MSWLAWLRRYLAHDDPEAAAANLVAMVIAWNGPFYPIYVIALVGWSGWPSLLTVLTSPVFFAIPWLMRRDTRLGRLALPLVGTANTICAAKILSPASGVEVFLVPCIVLAGLLFRPGERVPMLLAVGVGMAAYFVPAEFYEPALMTLSAGEAARLAALNLVSVIFLAALLAVQIAGILAAFARRP